jgi:linoleoyl-CoA desaturase
MTLTYNWAITTDFRQMKSYLKENYPWKLKVSSLDNINHYQSNLCVYLDCLPIVRSPGGKKLAFVMHYTAGLILSVVFQLAHVVENYKSIT